jgi:phenylpropionate dioxygenase-like ring-hydroxylating dioxygenase large terminal subunit
MRTVIFSKFQGHWTPIAVSTDVKQNKPSAFMLDDIPVVVFRDETGAARALVDRCPHRSIKLSLGKVSSGQLQCAFHGWRYDGTGTCKYIPLNPDAKLPAVKAQTIACEERGGLIWLYAGDASNPPVLNVPLPLDESGWYGSITQRDWSVHWSRAIQTALNVAHIPFVHPTSIGAAFGRALGKQPEARLWHELVRHDDGSFRMDWVLQFSSDSEPQDAGWVAFHPPNGMSLDIPQKRAGAQSLLFIWCVPLTRTSSRMIVVWCRNFGRFSLVPMLFELLTPVILAEDRRNMETAWPSALPSLGQEISVPSDAPTIAFQRYYAQNFPSASDCRSVTSALLD